METGNIMSNDLVPGGLRSPTLDVDVGDFTLIQNRIELMRRYNEAVGPPCDAISAVHADFIKGAMGAVEMSAFVRVCKRLIAASKARDAERRQNLRPRADGWVDRTRMR